MQNIRAVTHQDKDFEESFSLISLATVHICFVLVVEGLITVSTFILDQGRRPLLFGINYRPFSIRRNGASFAQRPRTKDATSQEPGWLRTSRGGSYVPEVASKSSLIPLWVPFQQAMCKKNVPTNGKRWFQIHHNGNNNSDLNTTRRAPSQTLLVVFWILILKNEWLGKVRVFF